MTNRVLPALVAAAFLAIAPAADDYQCVAHDGCTAIQSTENGTREVEFKRGDVVSTSGGWIVNPADGWTKIDAYLEVTFVLPEWAPDHAALELGVAVPGDPGPLPPGARALRALVGPGGGLVPLLGESSR